MIDGKSGLTIEGYGNGVCPCGENCKCGSDCSCREGARD